MTSTATVTDIKVTEDVHKPLVPPTDSSSPAGEDNKHAARKLSVQTDELLQTNKEAPLRRSNRGKGKHAPNEKTGAEDRMQSCIADSIEYKPGDYVYYEEPEFDYYTIGLIDEIKLSRRERCNLVVKCFWRTRDIPEVAKQALLDREPELTAKSSKELAILARELFASELQYTIYSNQLRGKCQIKSLADLRTALATFDADVEDSFYYIFAYNPETRRLLTTRAEIKVGSAYQVSSLPHCRHPLNTNRHRLKEKNGNTHKPQTHYIPNELKPNSLKRSVDEQPTEEKDVKRVKKEEESEQCSCGDSRHCEHQCLQRIKERPSKKWEQLVWLPNGLTGCETSMINGRSFDEASDRHLKIYLDAVRSLVAIFAFGGSDDDLISGENGHVVANLATTTQHAYDTLHESNYQLTKALAAVKDQPLVSNDTPQHWTADQVHRFYQAIAVHGKNFHNIYRDFFSPATARLKMPPNAFQHHSLTTSAPSNHALNPNHHHRGRKRRAQASSNNLLLRAGDQQERVGVKKGRKRLGHSVSVPAVLFSLGEEEKQEPEVEAPLNINSEKTSVVAVLKDVADDAKSTKADNEEQMEEEDEEEVEEEDINGGEEEEEDDENEDVIENASVKKEPKEQETANTALFQPTLEKTVKQLITFYYYWKRKSPSLVSNAAAQAAANAASAAASLQHQHHPSHASTFHGSAIETNFNCYGNKKRRPTGRGGIPLTTKAWFDVLDDRFSDQEKLSRRLRLRLTADTDSASPSSAESVTNSRPDSDAEDTSIDTPQRGRSEAGDCNSPCTETVPADAPTTLDSNATDTIVGTMSDCKSCVCKHCSQTIKPPQAGGFEETTSGEQCSMSQLRFLCASCQLHVRKYGELRPLPSTDTNPLITLIDHSNSEKIPNESQSGYIVNANSDVKNELKVDESLGKPPLKETNGGGVGHMHTVTSPACSFCEAYSPTYASSWPSPLQHSSNPHRGLSTPFHLSAAPIEMKLEQLPFTQHSEEAEELEVGDSPSVCKGKSLCMSDYERQQRKSFEDASGVKMESLSQQAVSTTSFAGCDQGNNRASRPCLMNIDESGRISAITPEPISLDDQNEVSEILFSQNVPPIVCASTVHRAKWGELERVWDRSITLPGDKGGGQSRVNSGSCARTDIVFTPSPLPYQQTGKMAQQQGNRQLPPQKRFTMSAITAEVPLAPPGFGESSTNASVSHQEPMELTSKSDQIYKLANPIHRKLSDASMLKSQQLDQASRFLPPAEFLSFARLVAEGSEPLNLKGGVTSPQIVPRSTLPHIVRGPFPPPIQTSSRLAAVEGTFYPPPGVPPMCSSVGPKQPQSQQHQPTRVSSSSSFSSSSSSASRHQQQQQQAFAQHHHQHQASRIPSSTPMSSLGAPNSIDFRGAGSPRDPEVFNRFLLEQLYASSVARPASFHPPPPPCSSADAKVAAFRQQQHLLAKGSNRFPSQPRHPLSNTHQSQQPLRVGSDQTAGVPMHHMMAAAQAAVRSIDNSGDQSNALTVATLAAAAVAEMVAQGNHHQQQQQHNHQAAVALAQHKQQQQMRSSAALSISQSQQSPTFSMAGGHNYANAANAILAQLQQHYLQQQQLQSQQQQQQSQQQKRSVSAASTAYVRGEQGRQGWPQQQPQTSTRMAHAGGGQSYRQEQQQQQPPPAPPLAHQPTPTTTFQPGMFPPGGTGGAFANRESVAALALTAQVTASRLSAASASQSIPQGHSALSPFSNTMQSPGAAAQAAQQQASISDYLRFLSMFSSQQQHPHHQ